MIREWVENMPKHVREVFITTHSPHLVRELAAVRPHYIYLGNSEGPKTVEEWLADQTGLIKPLLPGDLTSAGRARFNLLQKMINLKE